MIRAVIDRFLGMFLQCGIHINIVLLTDRLFHLRKQSRLIIIGCKSRQLICQNIICRRYQHDFGIPPVYQFFEGNDAGILHLLCVFLRIVYPDQIMIRSQIYAVDLLFPEHNIRAGLNSHPFIPTGELIGHIFFISIPVFPGEETFPGKNRPGRQYSVLRFRIDSVAVAQIGNSQNEKHRTHQSHRQESISFFIHTLFLLPG